MNVASTTLDFGDFHVRLQQIVAEIARESSAAGTPRVELTRPSDEKFGDYATNVALMLAAVLQEKPRVVAERIAARAVDIPGVESVDVAGPGFVNFTMRDSWFTEALAAVAIADGRWGAGVATTSQKILLEFVSANPTGPLVAASARHAAYGDSLARILRFAGHDVETEFYVNDAGRQVELFGASILARASGQDVPEDGYRGEYVAGIAEQLAAESTDDPALLGTRGVALMVASMRPELERFGVSFDRFQPESELHDSGIIEEALQLLEQHGHLYSADGAVWLRTTTFGDDKDRTVRRSNGVPTYFAADIGYLLNKFRRGHERLIYVLGADHHGYIARLRAATAALGYDIDSCEIIIMQMVQLVDGGELRKMSKRRGDFVEMRELVERIGVDAARYFMLQRSHDQSLDLDLELASQHTDANPVFYVQYAHARICSIIRRVADELELAVPGAEQIGLMEPGELRPAERRVIKRLAELPVVIAESAERRYPHKLAHYAHDLALDFSGFYRDCRVMGDGVAVETTIWRLGVCDAVRSVLEQTLALLGVSAPESM